MGHRDNSKAEEVDFKVVEAEEDMIALETRGHNPRTNRRRDTQSLDVSPGFWYTRSWDDDLYTIPRKIKVSGEYRTS
jgi:hypothetical protein